MWQDHMRTMKGQVLLGDVVTLGSTIEVQKRHFHKRGARSKYDMMAYFDEQVYRTVASTINLVSLLKNTGRTITTTTINIVSKLPENNISDRYVPMSIMI